MLYKLDLIKKDKKYSKANLMNIQCIRKYAMYQLFEKRV